VGSEEGDIGKTGLWKRKKVLKYEESSGRVVIEERGSVVANGPEHVVAGAADPNG